MTKRITKADKELLASRGLKRCSDCKRVLCFLDFSKNKSKKDGYHPQCRLCTSKRKKQWSVDNPDYMHKWHLDNPNYRQDYYKEHLERFAELGRQWKVDNPEKVKAKDHRRRSRKRQAEGHWKPEDIKALEVKQDMKCAYCGCDISTGYHIDHIHPLSRGGSNWASNLALACGTCNLSKGAKLLSEWKPDKTS